MAASAYGFSYNQIQSSFLESGTVWLEFGYVLWVQREVGVWFPFQSFTLLERFCCDSLDFV